MSRPEHLDWVQPQWWVGQPLSKYERLDVFVSRDQLISAWTAATVSPKPNKTTLRDQLKKWSSELGNCEWAHEPYGENGREVARRLVDGPTQILQQPEIWDQVCGVLADYGDALARRSGQYAEIIGEHRPRGLPKLFSNLRDWEKTQVCRAARDEMLESFKILESKQKAVQFIDNPELYADEIKSAAGREYNRLLIKFLLKQIADNNMTQKEQEAIDLLWIVSEDLKTAYGNPEPSLRDATPQELQEVKAQLNDFLERRPKIYREGGFRLRGRGYWLPGISGAGEYDRSDAISDAWSGTVKDLGKFKVKEIPITDDWIARIFTTKFKDAVKNLRKEVIDRAKTESLEGVGASSDDEGSVRSRLDVETVDSETEQQRVDIQGLLASARSVLQLRDVENLDAIGITSQLGGQQSWEKTVALEILSSDALVLADPNASSIYELFERRGMRSTLKNLIDTAQPEHRLFENSDTSARLVIALLKWSVSCVIDEDDIPDMEILGGRSKTETWPEKMHRLVTDVRASREASGTTSVWREK